jgi:hypothetical protein
MIENLGGIPLVIDLTVTNKVFQRKEGAHLTEKRRKILSLQPREDNTGEKDTAIVSVMIALPPTS